MAQKPGWIAGFDSAAGFLLALSAALHGREFRDLGQPAVIAPLARATSHLPRALSRTAFAVGGAVESIGQSRLGQVRSAEIGRWVSSVYPSGRYPMVFVGSSSGAVVNLCAALRVPWLPQTLLIPVRNLRGRSDDARQSCSLARQIAPVFLEANPDLALHHMHDPVQDRAMTNWMSYFRVKQLRLGEDYERFLEERLAPGGTIVPVDCRKRWPVRRIGPRHVFQFGAVGGLKPEGYLAPDERTRRWLTAQGSAPERWNAPPPDDEAAEAEWGFEPALARDAERFAAANGFRIARLSFDEPDALGPLVADLYRWWYARRGWQPDLRLLLESFVMTAPDRVLRTGSVPLWATFNTEHDLAGLRSYLDGRSFEEVAISLFPNGVNAVGQAGLDGWREQLGRARSRGYFLGVNERLFPFDFAGLANYHRAIRQLPVVHEVPPQLDPAELSTFLSEAAGQFPVEVNGL